MKFSEAEAQLRRIFELDFMERDDEILRGIVEVKEKMNERGLVNSTMTLRSLSEFLLAEFKVRIESISERSLWASKLQGSTEEQSSTSQPAGITFFCTLADEQCLHFQTSYDLNAKSIVSALQNKMAAEIREDMIRRMKSHISRTQLALELEYKVLQGASNHILNLRPTIYGMSVDLRELFKRFFRDLK